MNQDNDCHCQDDNYKMDKQCFRCKSMFLRKLSFVERVTICPHHRHAVAVCSPSVSLCNLCENDGWTLVYGSSPFDETLVVKKEDSNESSDDQ